MSTTARLEREVLEYLSRVVRLDENKGGNGLRSTRDVADALSITTAVARRVLWRLAGEDLVDCFDDTPLYWRITASGQAALTEAKP